MRKVINTHYFLHFICALFFSSLLSAQPQGDFVACIGTADDVKKIILFDPNDGSLVVDDFIDFTGYDPGTTKHVIQVGDELWISDQTKDRIYRLDINGNLLGMIGDDGGMDNVRGMRIVGDKVWLCNAGTSNGAPGNSIIQISFDGTITGNFLVSGSPWAVLPYDDEHVLISFSNSGGFSSQIALFDLSGNFIESWNVPSELNFIQQISEMSNGDYLASSFSTGGYPSGVHKYDGDGNYLGQVGGTANGGARGNAEIGNGNIMWTNAQGVHIADVGSGTSTLVYAGQFQYLEPMSFGPAPVLNPPTNLFATVDINNVSLIWEAPETKDLTGYNVYRDDILITASPVTETNYFDEGVSPGNHIYGVSAVYTNGESEKAGPVMVFIQGELGKIQGFVRDAVTNHPIADAWVIASNTDNGTLTYATPFGTHYVLWATAGTYNLTCGADGYESYELENIVVETGMVKSFTFYLMPQSGEILTGINNLTHDSFTLYPNPASNYVVIDGEQIQYLQIIDRTGQLILTQKPDGKNFRINLSEVPAGMYLVKIYTPDGVVVEKLLVE